MSYVEISYSDGLATVVLHRGKVNALNATVVGELDDGFNELRNNRSVKAVILTGHGKFFSFGFDVPEFLSLPKDAFTRFLKAFTDFYTKLYVYPKPVVGALNGHAIAGGCMLATACDHRVMALGGAKISLNEVTFGASVFAGSAEMLVACTGQRNAEKILYSGAMYDAEEALALGLVDQVSSAEKLMIAARERARKLAGQNPVSFKSIKALLREPIAKRMIDREAQSIREFVGIWYSESTWEQLKRIGIRE